MPQQRKPRTTSKSYTLRAFGENIRKLNEMGLITKEDFVTLREIQLKIVRTYLNE